MNKTIVKEYTPPNYDYKEIIRYMGAKNDYCTYSELIKSCINECYDKIKYNVCYTITDIKISDSIVSFGNFSIASKSLSAILHNCNSSIIFSATVGIGIDRLISKYSRISPSKALCFQAIGTERIEALCNLFCDDIGREYEKITSRFSPGYGDLDISVQKQIFTILDAYKNIGLTLNESLIMSPSKSVTAIIGIERKN